MPTAAVMGSDAGAVVSAVAVVGPIEAPTAEDKVKIMAIEVTTEVTTGDITHGLLRE